MTGAGYGAGPAVSGRTRLGAALAALGLHVLALAAALMLGALPAGKGNRDTGHLTVIALEPPRSAATRQAPARGAPARQAVAPAAAPAETAVSSPRQPAPVQAAGLPSKPAIPAAPTSIEAAPPQREVRDAGKAAAAAYASRLWQHIAARRPHGTQLRGTVVVRFRLSPAGSLLDAGIASSSGNLNLDRIALRCLRQAAPMPPPPDGLTGDQLVFTVPVEFR